VANSTVDVDAVSVVVALMLPVSSSAFSCTVCVSLAVVVKLSLLVWSLIWTVIDDEAVSLLVSLTLPVYVSSLLWTVLVSLALAVLLSVRV
jgi:hypothetical protein